MRQRGRLPRIPSQSQSEVLPLSFDQWLRQVRPRRQRPGYKNCLAPPKGANAPKGGDGHRVAVLPDILVHTRDPDADEFVVLACDGIWDRLTNRDCADLVRALACDVEGGETDPGLVCEEVIDTALELDSRDNMTCCVAFFPAAGLGRKARGGGVAGRRAEREF